MGRKAGSLRSICYSSYEVAIDARSVGNRHDFSEIPSRDSKAHSRAVKAPGGDGDAAGRVVDLTPDLALAAAELSIEHRLPMADSVILATARGHDATLWTQDEDFATIQNVRYVPGKQVTGVRDRKRAAVYRQVTRAW
jgi:predicted nucleic acid-binding protein